MKNVKYTMTAYVLAAMTMILLGTSLQAQDLQDIMGQLADPTKKAEVKSDYPFDGYIQMEWTTSQNDAAKGTKVVLNSYFSKDGASYAMEFSQEGTPMSIIFDKESNALLLLTEAEGNKMGMVMAVDGEAIQALSQGKGSASGEDVYEPLKTGNSKNILGYSCEEYLIEEGSSEIRVWASKKLGEEMGEETLGNQQAFGGAFTKAVFVNGMVMEFQSVDKVSGEKNSMAITSLELDRSHTISTSGYNVMSMGQFQ